MGEIARLGSRNPVVSVLTPSIPERADMLIEAEDSVVAQHGVRREHLVLVDAEHVGCARTLNALAQAAKGRWLFLLADDDLLLPGCLKAHLHASTQADIVYSPPIVEGEPEQPFHGNPPGIPSTCLISRNLWRWLNGYDESLDHCEDFDLFQRALAVGATFRRLEEQTWIYRFWGGNKSRQPKAA